MPPSIPRRTLRFALLGALALIVSFAASPRQPIAENYDAQTLHEGHHSGMPMTDEAMQRWVDEYFAEHPEVGRYQATGAPVAIFQAITGTFSADGDFVNTKIDTVTIMMGETVRWQRLVGSHTVTNGQDNFDPASGTIFDVALDAANPIFDFTFNDPGTFPFYCLPHVGSDMKGAVIVEGAVGVTPIPGITGQIGFATSPAPNPTRGTTSFRFALPVAGRATARVFDARGRLVSEILDRRLEPGTYGALWDGRDRTGNLAAPGVYFVQLALPDYRDSRRVVLSR